MKWKLKILKSSWNSNGQHDGAVAPWLHRENILGSNRVSRLGPLTSMDQQQEEVFREGWRGAEPVSCQYWPLLLYTTLKKWCQFDLQLLIPVLRRPHLFDTDIWKTFVGEGDKGKAAKGKWLIAKWVLVLGSLPYIFLHTGTKNSLLYHFSSSRLCWNHLIPLESQQSVETDTETHKRGRV